MAVRVLKFSTTSPKIDTPTGAKQGPFLVEHQDNTVVMPICQAENRDGLKFARGCIIGIGPEILGAVFIYILWEVWHFFR